MNRKKIEINPEIDNEFLEDEVQCFGADNIQALVKTDGDMTGDDLVCVFDMSCCGAW